MIDRKLFMQEWMAEGDEDIMIRDADGNVAVHDSPELSAVRAAVDVVLRGKTVELSMDGKLFSRFGLDAASGVYREERINGTGSL